MAITYPKSFKNCAVCNYWGGSRQAHSSGQFVIVDSSTLNGKCLLPNGPWKGMNRQAIMNCDKWARLGLL